MFCKEYKCRESGHGVPIIEKHRSTLTNKFYRVPQSVCDYRNRHTLNDQILFWWLDSNRSVGFIAF